MSLARGMSGMKSRGANDGMKKNNGRRNGNLPL